MSGRERLDKKLKQALKEVYHAPEPVRKVAFLNQHRQELASILGVPAPQLKISKFSQVSIADSFLRKW